MCLIHFCLDLHDKYIGSFVFIRQNFEAVIIYYNFMNYRQVLLHETRFEKKIYII